MAKKKQRPRPKELDKDELFDLVLAAYDHCMDGFNELDGREDRRSIEAKNQFLLAGDKLNEACSAIEEL